MTHWRFGDLEHGLKSSTFEYVALESCLKKDQHFKNYIFPGFPLSPWNIQEESMNSFLLF